MKKRIAILCAVIMMLPFSACGEKIRVNVPAKYALIMESYDEGDKSYKDMTVNGDGSVTYVFTKKQHEQFVSELKNKLDEAIADAEETQLIDKITVNEDYSNFRIFADISSPEQFLIYYAAVNPMSYTTLGEIYLVFQGNPEPDVYYDIINNATGEVVFSSKDWEYGANSSYNGADEE